MEGHAQPDQSQLSISDRLGTRGGWNALSAGNRTIAFTRGFVNCRNYATHVEKPVAELQQPAQIAG